MSYLDALVQAQIEEMERDERVILLGEDIAAYGGAKITERFDSTRVWNTPISETSFTGMAIGAAITGLRPIVDLTIASFVYLASDPIINQAAKLHFMTGGQVKVPIVFRCCMYYGNSVAAQHSDRPYPLFMNIPGLTLLYPTTPTDVKGLLKAAVRDDNPVVIFEDSKLWTGKEEVPVDPDFLIPIGQADVKRPGNDVTIVAIGAAVRPALDAAQEVSNDNFSVEVIDPRTLKPLDMETIYRSVAKTGRLVVVENAHQMCGVAAEVAALVSENAFKHLKAPVRRLTGGDLHVPFSPVLESGSYPSKDTIVEAIRMICW
jgi:pyruvate/2-oxoglutarate/acetoin dehydrogenase E1 component